VLFDSLVSLLERSFLMYADQSNSIKKRQWSGWLDYIRDYFESSTFRSLWVSRGDQFDSDFVSFMNELARERGYSDSVAT
jgi:hypothetical protein